MTELYLTDSRDLYEKTRRILRERCGEKADAKIDFSRQKPELIGTYGGIKHFNISHSGPMGAIALSDTPVGADVERYRGRERNAVLARYSSRERGEIDGERAFLAHWTAREAFIKMKGVTLAEYFKRVEFYRGNIYLDGAKQDLKIHFAYPGDGVAAVCTADAHVKIFGL